MNDDNNKTKKSNDKKKKIQTPSEKTGKRSGNSMTGKPLDKIDTKPQLSARNAFQESEDGGNAVASLDEKALSIVQRQKRARIARKNKAKLAKARKIAQRKMANKEKLEKRSRRKARNIVRMRFSGRKVP